MSSGDVTELILALERGGREDFDRLVERVYPELRRLAHAQMQGRHADHVMVPTELVHEAYLRLVRYQDVNWKGRTHFFGAASQTMRRVLVDYARARASQKRSGVREEVTLGALSSNVSLDSVLEIDDALRRLEAYRPRWVRVVECRFFAGLTIEETAESLGVSHATVSNDWKIARAWLHRELLS